MPYVTPSTPVRAQFGEVIGALVAGVAMDLLADFGDDAVHDIIGSVFGGGNDPEEQLTWVVAPTSLPAPPTAPCSATRAPHKELRLRSHRQKPVASKPVSSASRARRACVSIEAANNANRISAPVCKP